MDKKEFFLRNEFIQHIRQLDPAAERRWGKMNVQQMIEHMADAFRMANGKDKHSGILTEEEKLPRFQAFVLSDTPFKENTKNILLPEEPGEFRFQNMDESINELNQEVIDFFKVFENDKQQTIRNPFFGDLNFEYWVALLYKHCWHHLNQFGVTNSN
jgi:hypothetical protein